MYRFIKAKAGRACTRVWIGVDWGVPVRKLTRHHVRFLLKVDFGLPRANFSTQDDLDLEASRTSRKQTRHHAACVAREGILLWILAKLPVHAPCLDWSRLGRSGQKAHTVSCQIFASQAPRACTVSGLESIGAFPSESKGWLNFQECEWASTGHPVMFTAVTTLDVTSVAWGSEKI
jgi:hypothetical protein